MEKGKSAGSVSPSQQNTRENRDKWRQYEALKAMIPIEWTTEEYQEACQRIARELGIAEAAR